MSTTPIQLPLALVELIGKHWEGADAISDPVAAVAWFNRAMKAAYELGRDDSVAENDMVCEAVETVAQRQIDSIADAAIFSCLACLPDESPMSVIIDASLVSKITELFDCTKHYGESGITYRITSK